jgi:hypothetical protein
VSQNEGKKNDAAGSHHDFFAVGGLPKARRANFMRAHHGGSHYRVSLYFQIARVQSLSHLFQAKKTLTIQEYRSIFLHAFMEGQFCKGSMNEFIDIRLRAAQADG